MATQNEKLAAAENKYGVSANREQVFMMAGKGRAWIEAEVAKLKAARTAANAAKVDGIVAQARLAWEIAQ